VSQFNNSQIIAPPIEEETYPYRRVWRSVGLQISIMIVVAIVVVFSNTLIGVEFDSTITLILSLFIVALPVGLWLIFSVIPEYFVLQPRQHLVSLAVISGLTASAIGIPLLQEFFQIERWIPLQSAFDRIIGYTFTVGIVDTGLKFVVLRYLVFPLNIRMRTDTIAFCIACAIGYVTVININLIVNIQPTLSLAMIYVFGNYTMQITSSIILAYGISQTALDNALPLLLPAIIFVSAFIIGVVSPFESGLINGSLTINGAFTRPIFAIGFLTVVLIAIPSIIFFLYTVAERREEEKYSQ